VPAENTEQRKLAAIMFTDMVGYSALTQRNERLALELLEEHRRLLRELFPKFEGREVETTGDGFLCGLDRWHGCGCG
jgi:adenylate cyclase